MENILAHPQDVFLPIELFEIRKNKLQGLRGVDEVFEKIPKKNGAKNNKNTNIDIKTKKYLCQSHKYEKR